MNKAGRCLAPASLRRRSNVAFAAGSFAADRRSGTVVERKATRPRVCVIATSV